jgi:hypothetical protein
VVTVFRILRILRIHGSVFVVNIAFRLVTALALSRSLFFICVVGDLEIVLV